jgi:MFS family permease
VQILKQSESGEFRQGWRTVLASFTGLAFGVASLSVPYTIGVFVEPLREEFGWTRAEILAAVSMVSVSIGALSLALGWLTDRINVRRLIIGSQIAFGLAFFLMAFGIRSLPTFYGLYLLMAIAGLATLAIPFAKLITAEFVKHRGLALGLATSGTGFCGLAVPPFLAYVVENFGWRAGYVAIGLLPLLFALPMTLLFIRDRRSQAGAMTTCGGAPVIEGNADDIDLKKAIVGYRFWALFAIFVFASSVMTALLTNFIPLLADRGYPPTMAATMAGTFGLTLIIGRVTVGFLVDRFWAPMIGFIVFMPAALAIIALASLDLGTVGLVVVILLTGFAAGSEIDLMAYLVARYFGLRHFGKIFAGAYVGFALIPGLAAPLFGGSRDTLGTYIPGLYVLGAMLVVAGLLFLSLGRYPESADELTGESNVVEATT